MKIYKEEEILWKEKWNEYMFMRIETDILYYFIK